MVGVSSVNGCVFLPPVCSRMEWPIEIARQHGHNIISDVTYVLYVLRNLSITVSPP